MFGEPETGKIPRFTIRRSWALFLCLLCVLTFFTAPRLYAQLSIGSVLITGNSAFSSAELLEQFNLSIGDNFQKELFEQQLDDVVSFYEARGYPFAEVTIQSLTPNTKDSETSVDIVLSISEGQHVTINEIHASGNKETNENVITREARIIPGEVYNIKTVSKIPGRLMRLNIFSQVNEPVLTIHDSGGVLTIPVVEGSTNTFDVILGYIPSNEGADGYVTGVINISMRNLFGTSRKLGVHWQKEQAQTQEIALRYLEPWLFDFPVDVEGSFRQRQQETTYVSRGYSIKADVRMFDEFTVAGILSYETIIPSTTLTGASIPSSEITTTGIELRYDTRDDLVSPTRGLVYRNEYQIGKKQSSLSGNTSTASTVQKIGLDFAWYIQPIPRQVLSLELHGKEFSGDNISLAEMYRFGGTSSLRGYRENQFIGSRIGWTNTEYRFLLSRHSYIFGFFDTGYYFLPENISQNISQVQAFKYGYGIGIKLETTLGIIGVSVALGEGDPFNQAKIHFGLVNEF